MNWPRVNPKITTRLLRPTSRGPAKPGLSPWSGDPWTIKQNPDLVFYAIGFVLLVLMAPLLREPLLSVALVAVLAFGFVAWRSPAVPLALVGIPPLVDAIFGTDPLPSGGFTFLFSAWITVAVAFALLRGGRGLAIRALVLSIPVLASFALLGFMLLRLGISPDQSYGSTKVQLYAADVLIVLVGAVFVGTRSDYVAIFVLGLLIVDSTGALIFLVNLVGGAARTVVGGRYSLNADEYPIDLGRASAEGLLVAVYTVLSANRRAIRWGAMVAVPILAVALAAAGSRGPVVGLAFGLLALLALTAVNPRARRRLIVVAAVFMLAVVVVPLVVPSSVLARAFSSIIGSASGLSSNGRSQLWAIALAHFSNHLWIGVGTGGSASFVSGIEYPHNILLEVSVEFGLVGLSLLVLVLGGFVSALYRCWRLAQGADRLVVALFVSLFLTGFVNANFSDPIQGNGSLWLWGGLTIGMSARLMAQSSRGPLANA